MDDFGFVAFFPCRVLERREERLRGVDGRRANLDKEESSTDSLRFKKTDNSRSKAIADKKKMKQNLSLLLETKINEISRNLFST